MKGRRENRNSKKAGEPETKSVRSSRKRKRKQGPQLAVTAVTLDPKHLGHIKSVAVVMARAFCQSPFYKYIWGDDGDDAGREVFLAWLFERNIQARPTTTRVSLAGSVENIVCAFLFQASDIPPPRILEIVMKIGLQIPFSYGPRVLLRLLEVAKFCKSLLNITLKRGLHRSCDPFYQLERMAVTPEWQGKGVGSTSLLCALKTADERKMGVRLMTQEERNVRFYRKLGFEVVEKRDLTDRFGCTNWVMWRRPTGGGRAMI